MDTSQQGLLLDKKNSCLQSLRCLYNFVNLRKTFTGLVKILKKGELAWSPEEQVPWCNSGWNHLSKCENVWQSQIYRQYFTVATGCEGIPEISNVAGTLMVILRQKQTDLLSQGIIVIPVPLKVQAVSLILGIAPAWCQLFPWWFCVAHQHFWALESSLLETWWQIAVRKSADTHLLQWKELSLLLWIWRVGDCHHTTLSCIVSDVIPYGEACYLTCSNFVCLIKLIFKTVMMISRWRWFQDSVKGYNIEVLIQNEAPIWAKKLLILQQMSNLLIVVDYKYA